MFNNKLALLTFSVLLTLTGVARAALPASQLLIDRAHYWDKLGRRDMAIKTWQELLLLEPANAEALAAVAENNPQQQLPPVINPLMEDLTHSVSLPAKELIPTADVYVPFSQNLSHESVINSAIIPEPVTKQLKTLTEANRVEDWPALFSNGLDTQAEGQIASHEDELPQNVDEQSAEQEQRGQTITAAADPGRAANSLLAEPSVSALIDEPVKIKPDIEPGYATPAVSVPQDTVMTTAGAPVAVVTASSVQSAVNIPAVMTVTLAPPVASTLTTQPAILPVAEPLEKPDTVAKTTLPVGLTIDGTHKGTPITPSTKATEPTILVADKTAIQVMRPDLLPAQLPDNVINTTDRAVSAQPDAQTKPDAEEMARYWESRGRSDLAGQLRKQAHPEPAQALHPAALPMNQALAEAPAAAQLGAQKANNDEKAKYWEAHGRSDLVTLPRVLPSKSEQTVLPALSQASANNHAQQSALEISLLKNPDNLQARLALAEIYRAADETVKARVQIDNVLAVHPDLPEAILSSARLYAQQGLWPETLLTLEKVAPLLRTDEMGRLQKTAWAHMQIDRADALVRQGKNQEADLLLKRIAVELAVNYNQSVSAEPPPLWKSSQPIKPAEHH